jgi:hypothetical protein
MDQETPEDACNDACNAGAFKRHSRIGFSNKYTAEFPEREALSTYIMTIAYAMGVIILTIGAVTLTITLAVLCFLYPDKANAFVVLLGSPIAVMVITNTVRLAKLIRYKAKAIENAKDNSDKQ